MSSLNTNYNPFPYNDKEICEQDSLEYKIRWEWTMHEYIDDALIKATIVSALKLALFRKYPIIIRMPFIPTLCSAWYELRKFFLNFGRRAACKFGCKKVLM